MPVLPPPRLLKPEDFKPGQPPPSPPPPPKLDSFEQRQSEIKVIQTQLQNLQDQGPVTVELGKPTVLFAYTNGAGEVRQGFLELIRAESNQPPLALPQMPVETAPNVPNPTNGGGLSPQEEMRRLIEEQDAKSRSAPGSMAPPAAAPQAPEAAPALQPAEPLPAPGAPPPAE